MDNNEIIADKIIEAKKEILKIIKENANIKRIPVYATSASWLNNSCSSSQPQTYYYLTPEDIDKINIDDLDNQKREIRIFIGISDRIEKLISEWIINKATLTFFPKIWPIKLDYKDLQIGNPIDDINYIVEKLRKDIKSFIE